MDPSTSAAVFPIIARPDRPLPPIPTSFRHISQNDSDKVKAQKKISKTDSREKKRKTTDEAIGPPNRARRLRIDSTRWKPTHLRGIALTHLNAGLANSEPSNSGSPGTLNEQQDLRGSESEEDTASESSVDGEATVKSMPTAQQFFVHVNTGKSATDDNLRHLNLLTVASEPRSNDSIDVKTDQNHEIRNEISSMTGHLESKNNVQTKQDGKADFQLGQQNTLPALLEPDAYPQTLEQYLERDGIQGLNGDPANKEVSIGPAVQMQTLTELFQPQEIGGETVLAESL